MKKSRAPFCSLFFAPFLPLIYSGSELISSERHLVPLLPESSSSSGGSLVKASEHHSAFRKSLYFSTLPNRSLLHLLRGKEAPIG